MRKKITLVFVLFGVCFIVLVAYIIKGKNEIRAIKISNCFRTYVYTNENKGQVKEYFEYNPINEPNHILKSAPIMMFDDSIVINGQVQIDKNLVVNARQILIIKAGSILYFRNNVGIICYNQIRAKGYRGREIYFLPADSNSRWNNVTIIGDYDELKPSKESSIFSNCVFRNGSGILSRMTKRMDFDPTTNKPVFDEQGKTTRGGAICTFRANINVDSSIFQGNYATNGGAIYVRSGTLYLNNSLLENNKCIYTNKKIHNDPGGTTIFCRGDLFSQDATGLNPIIIGSQLYVSNTVFKNNQVESAKQKGDTTIVNGTVYLGFKHSILKIEHSVFDNNSVDACGAVIFHHSKILNSNVGIWLLNHNLFVNNKGSIDPFEASNAKGGALISISNLNSAEFYIKHNSFFNNSIRNKKSFNRNTFIYFNNPMNVSMEGNIVNDEIGIKTAYLSISNINLRDERSYVKLADNVFERSFYPFVSYPVYLYPDVAYDNDLERLKKDHLVFGETFKFLPFSNYPIDKSVTYFISESVEEHYLIIGVSFLLLYCLLTGKFLFLILTIHTFFGEKIARAGLFIFSRFMLSRKTIIIVFTGYFEHIRQTFPTSFNASNITVYDFYGGIPVIIEKEEVFNEIVKDENKRKEHFCEYFKQYIERKNKLLFFAITIDDGFIKEIITFYESRGIFKIQNIPVTLTS